MKTEKEIRDDLHEVKAQRRVEGKKPLGPAAESHYYTAIRTVQTLSREEVIRERDKLQEIIKTTSDKWPDYFENFTAFRLKHEANHEAAVKTEFNKVYGLPKLKHRLKWVNYVLE